MLELRGDRSGGVHRRIGVGDPVVIDRAIVAAGGSLPEEAASVMAPIRKERDIDIGNVIGSNLFSVHGCPDLIE